MPKGLSVTIAAIAPGLYSVGMDLAAASALRVATDGTQTVVPVISCGGQTCTSVPIDVSGDPVYLSLYGTGFEDASAAESSCVIAGRTLPLTYAGPQIQTAGLDQLNLLLPATLAGTGATSVVCSFRSRQGVFGVTNTVNLTIR